MKNLLSFLLPAAILLSGCTQEELRNSQPDFQDGRTFTASFEQDRTRTYVEDGNLLRWTAGDQISLFDGNTLNRQYMFDGETGDNSGTFSIVDKPYGTGNALSANYAVYPYSSDVKITESGVFTVTLPAQQNYAENSFGQGANTMVAVTKDTDDTFMKFRNVSGYLKLQLYADDVTVKSITLTGNNNEKLAGKASITLAYGDEPAITMFDDATSSITLNCGEGVKIGTTKETSTSFWIVVPPVAFEDGLTVTVEDIEGGTFTKSTSNEIKFTRNVIRPMKAFKVEIEETEDGIPHNQIWYMATAKVEPYFKNAFGANITSNVWDETTGNGIITFDGDVTAIGNQAFYMCKDLVSIHIPNSVTEVGSSAFSYCYNLLSVDMPDSIITMGEKVFVNCLNLSVFNIPAGVTSIGRYVFQNCESLKEVNIPYGLKSIGWGAFAYCDGLTDINIPDSVTAIESYAFENCTALASVSIPNSVIIISDNAFSYCENLSSVIIGDNVTTIGLGAFRYCNSLTEITIPDKVASIGASAFWGCGKLSSITLSNNLSSIENCLFYQCISLETVTIPDGVSSIGKESFRYCSSLSNITIPDNVVKIGDYAFYDCSNLKEIYCMSTTPPSGSFAFDKNVSDLKIYVNNVCMDEYKSAWSNYAGMIYPNGNDPDEALTYIYYTTYDRQPVSSDKLAIKSNTYDNGQGEMVVYGELKLIPDKAFYNCDKLISIRIPDSVNLIGECAFEDCSNLLSVDFGVGVATLGYRSFYNCGNLTSVILLDNITTIDSYAFNKCSKLESVTLGKGIKEIDLYVFLYCDSLKEFKGEFASEDGRCLVLDGELRYFAPNGITEYTIPDNITSVGWCAFSNIGSLISITIPDGVTTIGDYAFSSCNNLVRATISSSVEYIGSSAFNYCSSLKSVYCMPTTPPRLADYVFYNNASGRKIYVPYESVDKYKDSYANNGWNDYEYYYAIIGYRF